MKTKFYSFFAMVVIAATIFSCSEDADPPIVEIFFEVDENDQYTVNFTTTDQNVTSYLWDFGDGENSTVANPVHTYKQSGDYSVKVTVTGEGGTAMATKEVSIAASMAEMLSGGPAADKGKTWILSRTATPGIDGAGAFSSNFPTDIMPGTDNILDMVGLGSEYDNEFTFYHDGSYKINNVDGNNLAGWVYSAGVIGEGNIVITTPVGIFSVKTTVPANATWSLTEDTDLVVEAVDEDENAAGIPKTVTFSGADFLTFTNGGYIGIQDFATNAIIRDITKDRMVVSIYLHSVLDSPSKPSNLITLSFDAK
ncbi:PKD domain-containing protein [Mariniphaga anaerophila]|uniref:PKD domain-containing protein n=1 Tax=Mariniphaga anaerophila TaxID=1484053 RepID=A0A1M4XKC2_9BACT|nr:PKD domain-containing protein [Mariniphaga anaerophila]SHE94067.1 PKD domain-containing protein [Mariniphaga anaerophila]